MWCMLYLGNSESFRWKKCYKKVTWFLSFLWFLFMLAMDYYLNFGRIVGSGVVSLMQDRGRHTI